LECGARRQVWPPAIRGRCSRNPAETLPQNGNELQRIACADFSSASIPKAAARPRNRAAYRQVGRSGLRVLVIFQKVEDGASTSAKRSLNDSYTSPSPKVPSAQNRHGGATGRPLSFSASAIPVGIGRPRRPVRRWSKNFGSAGAWLAAPPAAKWPDSRPMISGEEAGQGAARGPGNGR